METKDIKDTNYNENLLYVAIATKQSLERYAAAERSRNKGSAIEPLITWKSMAQHILKNEVQKRGFYKGVGKK